MGASRRATSWGPLLAALVIACSPSGPREIAYGDEACSYCRMAITDPRFGAEVRTARGRVEAFDSIECAAGYVRSIPAEDVAGIWVNDYEQPGTFVPVEHATFWRATDASSPMGSGLVASASRQPPAGLAVRGSALDWSGVLVEVARDDASHGSPSAMGGVRAPSY